VIPGRPLLRLLASKKAFHGIAGGPGYVPNQSSDLFKPCFADSNRKVITYLRRHSLCMRTGSVYVLYETSSHD
jgi:hypothetical protein